jgi:phosphotransferase system HPr (HPr) family protein
MRVHEIQVRNHLSPDALKAISKTASRFQSDIYAYLHDNTVQIDVKSLMGLMVQNIPKGTRLTVKTIGDDDLEALEEMCRLFENA